MKKIIFQGLITILLFFGTWFSMTKLNWLDIFKIQKITDTTEQKLGDLFWDVFKRAETENKNKHIINAVDSIVTHICKANKIDKEKIKIHIF